MAACAKTFDVDVSTGRPAAANEAYYHGETIEFRAVRGRSVVTNIEYGCIYYQTNGMGDAWWKTDGLTFHPTNDVGAASYRFFMEGRESAGADHRAARDWHANGLLRLLPSPGFTPNEIELPVATLDFATVDVLNPPYYSKAETEAKIVELADDLADISSRIDAASGPQRYVLSATPDYYYSGDASIPAGYYYRAVTGGGYCRYAARVPISQGSVVLSGAADDPIIAKFGSEIPIDHNWITIETLSGLETDGQYNIADIVFSPDTSLGLTVLFHCNILNPVPEFADVSFTPASGSITFVHGGVQHTCTIASHSSLACTYTDAAYDMQSGTWSTGTYTLSASFIQSSATDWGVGTFGGAELATKDDLNPEIAKVLGIRTGLDGEYAGEARRRCKLAFSGLRNCHADNTSRSRPAIHNVSSGIIPVHSCRSAEPSGEARNPSVTITPNN